MAINLTASQCPAPQCRTQFLSIADAGTGTGTARVADNIAQGQNNGVGADLRRNAARQDLTGAYGGGAYFVAQGLYLSVSGGLVTVSVGAAMIDGPVCVEVAESIALPTGTVYLWLLQTGLLTALPNTSPPTSGPACYLGCVSAGAVDTSGVLYGLGILLRRTADAGMPTDAPPPSLHFVTQTQGGHYFWDGAAYTQWDGTGGGGSGTGGAVVWGEVPAGAVDGTNNAFTLEYAPTAIPAVYVRRLRLGPADLSVSGTNLTITTPACIPGPGDSFLADYSH